MSLFGRIAKIMRAELGRDSSSEFEERKDDFSSAHPRNDDPPKRPDKTQPGQDTRIAGFYANLEVPYGSNLKTVHKAWKKMVRQYHPDMHSNDPQKVKLANEIVQGLNNAYKELEKYLGN